MSTEAAPTLTESPLNVRDQAVHTGLAFAQALSFRRGDGTESRRLQQTMWRLRDSLSYRAESLGWHAGLLDVLHRSAIRRLTDAFPDSIHDPRLMYLFANEHHWIFDDLVFNAIALFDYIGNVVDFTLYGDHRRETKWDGAQKYSRDQAQDRRKNSRPRLHGSIVGGRIILTHDELVRRLSDYRADIIHHQARTGNARLRTRLGGLPAGVAFDLTVTAPSEFTKRFTVPNNGNTEHGPSIADAAMWLVVCVEAHARAVLRALEIELLVEAGAAPTGRATHVEIF